MRGVAAGLSHMHQSGVVHVDMKPENVFLKRDGEGTLSPKIGDFGLSLGGLGNASYGIAYALTTG